MSRRLFLTWVAILLAVPGCYKARKYLPRDKVDSSTPAQGPAKPDGNNPAPAEATKKDVPSLPPDFQWERARPDKARPVPQDDVPLEYVTEVQPAELIPAVAHLGPRV